MKNIYLSLPLILSILACQGAEIEAPCASSLASQDVGLKNYKAKNNAVSPVPSSKDESDASDIVGPDDLLPGDGDDDDSPIGIGTCMLRYRNNIDFGEFNSRWISGETSTESINIVNEGDGPCYISSVEILANPECTCGCGCGDMFFLHTEIDSTLVLAPGEGSSFEVQFVTPWSYAKPEMRSTLEIKLAGQDQASASIDAATSPDTARIALRAQCESCYDLDEDGIQNEADNCLFVPNEQQENNDNDEYGNACDNCIDTDNPDQGDDDEDGIGDACDGDYSDDGTEIEIPNEIQTIFTEHGCSDCHGSMGGLSVATFDGLCDGGQNGQAIMPGNHANSLVWIWTNNGTMPYGSYSDLEDSEQNALAAWIDSLPDDACD